MAGPLNGSGKDPKPKTNITSLDEVRKRAIADAKREQRAALGPNIWRDRIIGGIFILMALGMIAHWLAPLFKASGVAK
jgi:hypothetical protein